MGKRFLAILFLCVSQVVFAQVDQLPPWQEGFLDIHHISTGRGVGAFFILPDGTTMMIDPGDLTPEPENSDRRSPAIPNDSLTAAQWIFNYIEEFHPKKENAVLDYVLLTHYHDDHIGHFDNTVKKTHPEGKYKLSGVTELGSLIKIKTLIDRGTDDPFDLKDIQQWDKIDKGYSSFIEQLQNYWRFVEYQEETNGLKHEKIIVGSSDQIHLVNDLEDFPNFKIKNLFANCEISNSWDGEVSIKKHINIEDFSENDLCIGIRLSYGKFDYYTGGDIPGIGATGQNDFSSMEALAAPVIGPVDVATLNHHGNRNSQNEYYVRTVRPRVWIGQSWSSNHPGINVLRRITSKDLYPGERDLFTNYMSEANIKVNGRKMKDSYKSLSGHIVVRVYPGGDKYDVFVLNDMSENRFVKAVYHYKSR